MASVNAVQGPAAIRKKFNNDWREGVPIHLIEGSNFRDKPTKGPYAILRIKESGGRVASAGGPTIRHRTDGHIIVEIHVPEGEGDGLARELAQHACNLLRGFQEDSLVVWTAYSIPLGIKDGWIRFNVLAPFKRDEDVTT